MYPTINVCEPYLTNGEINAEITFSKEHAYVNPPKGVVFSQDSAGNMYLDGKPAHIKYLNKTYHFSAKREWIK